jgi:glycosyltransferase involved in cell wall biosynthesis
MRRLGVPFRVAMVSEHASPLAVLGGVDAGGQNVFVADLARALGRLGVEVVVHTRRTDPELPRRVPFAEGVVVEHVDAGPAVPVFWDRMLPFMPAFRRSLAHSWADEPPDLVSSHFWMSGLASLEAAVPLGVPLVHTYHALGVVRRREKGDADSSPPERTGIEAMLARSADHIVATTTDEVFELLGMGGSVDRITVIPCGVDLERFHPDGAVAPRTARPRLVVVSRLVERKGIGNVIEAVRDTPEVELLIAGGPPLEQLERDPEARRLLALIAELGVGDRVRLLGGVARPELPALLRSADLVACCPWYEQFGMVAVEAMACGVPVVASHVGGLAETVQDGVTGVHVPPRRPDRIADAVIRLLAVPDRRRRMGAAAVSRARRYGWDRIAAETLELGRDVAATAPAPDRAASGAAG